MGKKGELVFDELIPWIIVAVVLGLGLYLYFKIGGKGAGFLDWFKELWRFGT